MNKITLKMPAIQQFSVSSTQNDQYKQKWQCIKTRAVQGQNFKSRRTTMILRIRGKMEIKNLFILSKMPNHISYFTGMCWLLPNWMLTCNITTCQLQICNGKPKYFQIKVHTQSNKYHVAWKCLSPKLRRCKLQLLQIKSFVASLHLPIHGISLFSIRYSNTHCIYIGRSKSNASYLFPWKLQ
jgi:hypothetical protein